jgi:DNA-binding transcriptional LysR family regulator
MDLRALRSFLALVKHRNFARAAQEVGISQPAVTMHLRKLERDLQTLLIERLPGNPKAYKGVRLTEAGEEVYWRARRIVREADAIETALYGSGGRSPGYVCVGFTSEYRSSVAAAVAWLLQRNLSIPVELAEKEDAIRLEEDVELGNVHLGLFTGFSKREDASYSFARLADAPFRLVVNRKHPRAGGQGVQHIKELARERLVLPRLHSIERLAFGRAYEVHKHLQREIVQTETSSEALACVRVTPSLVTVTVAPPPKDERELVFLPLPAVKEEPPMTHLIWRGEPSKEAVRQVAAAIRAQFPKADSHV